MRKINSIIILLALLGFSCSQTDIPELSTEETFNEIPQVTTIEHNVDVEIPDQGRIGEIQYMNDSTSYWSVGSTANGWRITKIYKVERTKSKPLELFSVEDEGPGHFEFLNSQKGILTTRANTRSTLWLTKNGGKNWSSVNEQLSINTIGVFEAPDENHIFFITGGNFYSSSDFGDTWTSNPYPSDVGGFDKLYFLNNKIGFIFFCPTYGACSTLSTTDGGIFWTQYESGNPYNSRIWDVQMINENEGYGSFRSLENLYITNDGCRTWMKIGEEEVDPDVGLFYIFPDGRTLAYNGSSISYSRNYGDSLVVFSGLTSYETRGGSRTFLQTNLLQPLYNNTFILTGLRSSLKIEFAEDSNQANK